MVFNPSKPANYVLEFLEEFPDASWRERLLFFTASYPARSASGAFDWLIEGGVAVYLTNPSRREPRDVDILTTSSNIKQELVNTPGFDVKTPELWLGQRKLPTTASAQRKLLSSASLVDVDGLSVPILNPVALAVSKFISTHPYESRRVQDLDDLDLLNVELSEIHAFIDNFND